MARLCNDAGRSLDMLNYVRLLVGHGHDLSSDESSLFSIAFREVVSAKRTSWRAVSSMERSPEWAKNTDALATIRSHKGSIQKEIVSLCREVIRLIHSSILPASTTSESRVHFNKLLVRF